MNGSQDEGAGSKYLVGVPSIADDSLIALADAAEMRVSAINRIKRAALAVTNPHDWTDQNDKPYVQASGAEKIARLFGISWRLYEPEYERYEDGHFSYTIKGEFSMGTASIEAIGARTSKDGFFSRRKGQDLPPSEIDRNDIKKSALTNCLGNGITRLLGIRNLSWDDLAEAGISKGQVTKIEYGKEELSDDAKGQKESIRKMILEMVSNNGHKAQEMLLEITSFIGKDGTQVKGKRSVDDLSEKAIGVTYGKVKTAYEKWQKQQQGAGESGGAA